MIRRRSTLDHNQKIKKKKQVETLAVLDLCLQISVDDRLIIRNRVKNQDIQLTNRIHHCKKDKNYQELQVYLRKYLLNIKAPNRYGYSTSKNRDYSSKRSNNTASISKIPNIQTQASFKNSLRGSYQSSPQNKKLKSQSTLTIANFELIQKKIQFQIDNEVSKQIRKDQLLTQACRGVTPRDQQQQQSQIFDNSAMLMKNQSQYIQCANNAAVWNKKLQTQSNIVEQSMNIKNIIQQKIRMKQNKTHTDLHNLHMDKKPNLFLNRKQNHKLIISRCDKQKRVALKQSREESTRNTKFGQFYNKIRETIESDQ